MVVVRILTVSERDQAEIKRVREYAERPENVWRVVLPGEKAPFIPGNRPEYVALCQDIGLRCVFTISDWTTVPETRMGLTRHLSVSAPRWATRELPDFFAVETILPYFGFQCSATDAFMGAAENNPENPIVNVVLCSNLDGTCLRRHPHDAN